MVRIQDDLFEAVNAEWLAKTEIPSDRLLFYRILQIQS
jgi:putative endopeptidase